jgi:FkbM family methyltransferase
MPRACGGSGRRLSPSSSASFSKIDRLVGGRYLGNFVVEPIFKGVNALDDCRPGTNDDTFTTFLRGALCLHRYEEPERLAIVRFLDPALPVIELGASVGAITCLINRRLKDPRGHIAVEPAAELHSRLSRNRELNRGGFTIVHAGVGYGSDALRFSSGGDNLEGRVSSERAGGAEVAAVTLQGLLDRFNFPRASLVCDIEGMEVDMLDREASVIAERIAWIFIELHGWIYGEATVHRLVHQLEEQGFTHVWTRSAAYVFRNTRLT